MRGSERMTHHAAVAAAASAGVAAEQCTSKTAARRIAAACHSLPASASRSADTASQAHDNHPSILNFHPTNCP